MTINKDLINKLLIPEESLSKETIKNVNRVLKSPLFRYTCTEPTGSEVFLLEKEFAEYIDSKFTLAVSSCSSAMFLSLLCAGVKPGDMVLIPAFTFTAVPSAVVQANAIPVLVECQDNYCIDVDDLKKNITKETKFLLLSYMRGHISDLDQIVDICNENDIFLIEDCAHSLGVFWNGKHTGTIGKIGCFSFQSYKIINGGEGGLLVTDDEEIIAKAVIYSGSYEKTWKKHYAKSKYFPKFQKYLPTYNMRMSNITASIIRPQLLLIEEKVNHYNKNYYALIDILSSSKYINIPKRYEKASIAADTIQFNLKYLNSDQVKKYAELIKLEGIPISVIGIDEDNARAFWNWKFIDSIPDALKTREILSSLCDMRLPLTLSLEDIEVIGKTILKVIDKVIK